MTALDPLSIETEVSGVIGRFEPFVEEPFNQLGMREFWNADLSDRDPKGHSSTVSNR